MHIDENFTQHRTQDNPFVTPVGEPFKTPSSRCSRRRETLAVSSFVMKCVLCDIDIHLIL